MPKHAQLTTDQTFTGKMHLEPATDSEDVFTIKQKTAGYTCFNVNTTTGFTSVSNFDVQSITCLDGDLCIWATSQDAQIGIYDRTGTHGANLDANSLTTTQTFTFPDATGTIALETGASGSFTSADGKTVTVVNGLITSIV
jgi:hypothetical protein